MHIDDAHDDNMVADETALLVHTSAQSWAALAVSIIEPTPSSPSIDPTADSVDHPTESAIPPRSAHTSTHPHVLRTRSQFVTISMIFPSWRSHELSSSIQLSSFYLLTTNLMLLEKCGSWCGCSETDQVQSCTDYTRFISAVSQRHHYTNILHKSRTQPWSRSRRRSQCTHCHQTYTPSR